MLLFFVYHSLDFKLPKDVSVKLYSDGLVYLAFPTSFSVPCRIDARLFPFDTQRCNATFEPWDHSIEEVKLTLSIGDVKFTLQNPDEWRARSISNFVDNGVWDLIDINFQEVANLHLFGEYSAIAVILMISRRPLFYVLIVIIPCTLLSMITLMVFILPVESGEKNFLRYQQCAGIDAFSTTVFRDHGARHQINHH